MNGGLLVGESKLMESRVIFPRASKSVEIWPWTDVLKTLIKTVPVRLVVLEPRGMVYAAYETLVHNNVS